MRSPHAIAQVDFSARYRPVANTKSQEIPMPNGRAAVARALALAAGLMCQTLPAAAHGAPEETVQPQFMQALPNVPGKTFTSAIVDFAPGAKAQAHRHGQAFVYAYVLKGAVRSAIDDQPPRVYRSGENWSEPPGARHPLTENASRSQPARLLVVFVADTGAALKIPDQP